MNTSVFAIADLHLSGAVDKPMYIFGDKWKEHWNRIKDDWAARVTDRDIVLIPGDISWAMRLPEAKPDLDAIGSLPGKKIMIKGNHDYWWSSLSKVRNMLMPSACVIQNDSIELSGFTFCGTRGWVNPGMKDFTAQDAKIYNREVVRLQLSLESTGYEESESTNDRLIVLLHFPPFDDKGHETDLVKLLSRYKPAHVVYGHLHGEGAKNAFEGVYQGSEYHLVSCDYLDFKLKKII
ncbi:MAG: metallophosphoesterase [Caldicoprobacterales bacterium]|jgi:predicted phosphohydrolase